VVERIQGDRKEEVRMWDWARRRLEKTRSETLTAIAVERSLFETMIQRAHASGLAIPDIAEGALVQLTTYETQAKTATDREELERLEVRAIHQGELRAYICPGSEIKAEALLEIDLMEEWGVPPESMRAFRKAVEPGLASADVAVARGALRKVFEECDSWSDYVEEHYRYNALVDGQPLGGDISSDRVRNSVVQVAQRSSCRMSLCWRRRWLC